MGAFLNVIGVVIAAWQSTLANEVLPAEEPAGNTAFMLMACCCCVFFIIAIVVLIVVLVKRNKKVRTFTIDETMTRTTPCLDCGGIVSKRAENCPHCGAPVSQIDPPTQDPHGN